MRVRRLRVIVAGLGLGLGLQAANARGGGPEPARVELTLDTTEADGALKILSEAAAHQAIPEAEWNALFATAPYQWLKARESSMGRPFTEEAFKQFLLSPEALGKRAEWETTLAGTKATDMKALGAGVLAWLPPGARIQARVFPEIKPQHNSFVWTKPGEGPAIFLYLGHQSRDQFENTVAHECHHIGLDSLEKQQEAIMAGLPANVQRAMKWMTAFGEGEAMLAAAGSAGRHPHWEDDALTRARWDSDMMHFNSDLGEVQQLLMDILDGKLTTDEEIQRRAAPFWGVQGAWYTVGYEMAALVETQYGREAFDACLLDPRKLLAMYNQVAAEADEKQGAHLATWSPELLNRLNGAA